MARRFRQLVSILWERELGIRRARPHAIPLRQHQRLADQGGGPEIPLGSQWAPTFRPPRLDRSRALTGECLGLSASGGTQYPHWPQCFASTVSREQASRSSAKGQDSARAASIISFLAAKKKLRPRISQTSMTGSKTICSVPFAKTMIQVARLLRCLSLW